MSKNQREHIALITGASNGIGLALTRKMLSENWQVVALNRSDFQRTIDSSKIISRTDGSEPIK